MNTLCPDKNPLDWCGSLCLAGILCAIGLGSKMTLAQPSDGNDTKVAHPTMQRVSLMSDRALFFEFAVARGPGTPALIEIGIGAGVSRDGTLYFPFGVLRRIHTDSWPFRWSIADSAIYCTQLVAGLAPWPAPPGLYRYPSNALAAGPDDGRWPLDDARILASFRTAGRSASLDYGSCIPIRDALHGFHRGWGTEQPRSGDSAKVVHYDIRALDEKQVELYLTADGELYKWLYDGKAWKYGRVYPVPVANEFLVLENGKSLVTDQEGKWCLIRNIEDDNAKCEPLAERVEGQPLTLVEDRVEHTGYFLHRDRVLDDKGRTLATLRPSTNDTDRVRQAVDAVVARRTQP